MQVLVELTGTSPLLMHNPRMLDPDFELVRELSAITSKRKKNDDDRRRMEMLEWFGGLYERDGSVVLPTAMLRKCLIDTAKISKLGKTVERAVAPLAMDVKLTHEGPDDPRELFASGNGCISRLPARVGTARVMRVRPQFMQWSISAEAELIDDAGLNFDELERIVELAGRATGIGDGRSIGYGRFVGKVTAS